MKTELRSFRIHFLRELEEGGATESLISELEGAAAFEWEAWAQAIDESPYGSSEWASALIRFEAWVRENQRTVNSTRMREYLGCCIEGAGARSPLQPLPDLLLDYLLNHGIA
jgi:hypothetical protein